MKIGNKEYRVVGEYGYDPEIRKGCWAWRIEYKKANKLYGDSRFQNNVVKPPVVYWHIVTRLSSEGKEKIIRFDTKEDAIQFLKETGEDERQELIIIEDF